MKLTPRPITVFETDESEVIVVHGGYLWRWWEPAPGEQFVPAVGAVEYFRGSGREDIARAVVRYEGREEEE